MAEDVFRDGREAERLLNDPAFQKALQRMENDAVERWKAATLAAQREAEHATVWAIQELRNTLEAMTGDKAMAEARERSTKG